MKKISTLLCALVILLSASACSTTGAAQTSQTASTPALEDPAPHEEVARGLSYGIVPQALQSDYDAVILCSEFSEMLSTVVELTQADKLPAWENVAKTSLTLSEEIEREDAMIAVYEAACVLEKGVDTNSSWWEIDALTENRPHFWELSYNYPQWSNLQETAPFCTEGDNMICAAYHYAQGQCSPISGKRVFDLDEDNLDFHMLDKLTRTGAIEIAVRFYESVASDKLADAAAAAEHAELEALIAARKSAILSTESDYSASGAVYYVSNDGDDSNDGLSPETAWATLDKVNSCAWTSEFQLNNPDFPEFTWASEHPQERSELKSGDAVLFERGGLWRGMLRTVAGVSYSAYGEGEKPRIYGSPENGAGADKWALVEGTDNIWKFHTPLQQVGIILCDEDTVALRDYAYWDGEKHIKMNSNATHEWSEVQAFPELTPETITENLHFFCDVRSENNFSNPATFGDLYLRCDEGNPGVLFSSMEFATGNDAWSLALVSVQNGVLLDNLCMRFGSSGVIAHSSEGACIRSCEVSWIGGMCMNPGNITDEPEKCTLMCSGDAIMIGGVNNSAINNYNFNIFDYGITIEALTGDSNEPYRRGCTATDNLLEKCNGGLLVVDWNAMHAVRNAPVFSDLTLMGNIVADTACNEWAHYDQRYDDSGRYLLESEGCGALALWINPGCKNIAVRDNIFAFTYKGENLVRIARFDGDMSWLTADGNTFIANTGDNFISINDYDSSGTNDSYLKYMFTGLAAQTVQEQLQDSSCKISLIAP